jgi:nitroreductase
MSRLLRVADPDGWGLRLSCGAATYNLRLAFAVQGAPLDVEWQPRPGDPELLAVLRPATPKPPTPLERRLYAAIPRRHSNRRPFRDEPVPLPARVALIDAARETSAWLELVSGTVPVAAMAEIAQAANRVLRRDAAYIAELASWTRRGEASDGVPAVAGGPSPEPQDLLPLRPFSDLVRLPGKDFEPEPLIAVLGTLGDRPVDRLMAGQALQRVLLTVTDLGLASSMFSQPIEVPSAREQLRIALGRYGAPQMVLRIGFGDPGSPTPRRPAAEVIDEHLAGPEPETGPMAGVESR